MADNIPYWQMTPEQQLAALSQGIVPTQYAAPTTALANSVVPGTSSGPNVTGGGGGGGQEGGSILGSAFGWLGNNAEGIGSLLQGIGALGSLYGTNQQIGIAKDQLKLQKEAYNTNLNNQIASYNTNLEDKIRGRYSSVDQSEAQVQDYLNKNRMTR